MTPARLAEPQIAAENPALAWMRCKLVERGIDPTAPEPTTSEPEPEPIPAVAAAQQRIPADYRAARPEHPDITAWVESVADSAVAPHADSLNPHWGTAGRCRIASGPSLLLWGGTGTGKTHQAYGAIRALTAAGCAVTWQAATAADLYAQLRPRPGVDPEHQLQRLLRTPLLLVDDLGAAKTSEWTEEITFRLVNWRCQHRMPTIFTTNLPPIRTDGIDPRHPVLRDKVGDRILSRLSGMCTPVHFTGPDRRFAPR